jgi:ankyrin repeat protein
MEKSELLTAARNGNLQRVQLILLQKVAFVDEVDEQKYTALHLATQHGHTDVILLLIDRRAIIDAAN